MDVGQSWDLQCIKGLIWGTGISYTYLLQEINVTYINANLIENDFRIKKINTKEEVEFHKKEINAIILAEIKGEDIDITSDSKNDEDELEIL